MSCTGSGIASLIDNECPCTDGAAEGGDCEIISGMSNMWAGITIAVVVLIVIMLILWLTGSFKDGFTDLINEGNLSNMLYFQQPYAGSFKKDH
jgi:hypothetical protein